MAKPINIVEVVNTLVQAECQKKGTKFKELNEAEVIKFAISGVKHRLHNVAYNKKSREKSKVLDKMVEAGLLTQEQVDAMLSDD